MAMGFGFVHSSAALVAVMSTEHPKSTDLDTYLMAARAHQPRTRPLPRPSGFIYRWNWRTKLPERHGQLMRLLCSGRLGSCGVEFEDGWTAVVSINALRRAS